MLDAKDDLLRARQLEILALLPIGIVLGVLTGALMNAINGWVSPNYFGRVFYMWSYTVDFELWKLIVKHGMLEGLVFGIVSSLILTIGIGFISKLRCPRRSGIKVLLQVIGFSFIFWLVGGLNGVLFALMNPDFFGDFVRYHAGATPFILKIGWVGGSILGVYFGSILSTIGALFSFARKWRQLEKQAQI